MVRQPQPLAGRAEELFDSLLVPAGHVPVVPAGVVHARLLLIRPLGGQVALDLGHGRFGTTTGRGPVRL